MTLGNDRLIYTDYRFADSFVCFVFYVAFNNNTAIARHFLSKLQVLLVPDTGESVVILNPVIMTPKKESHYYKTRDLAHRDGRFTTTPPRRTFYHYTTETDVLPLHHRDGRFTTTPPRRSHRVCIANREIRNRASMLLVCSYPRNSWFEFQNRIVHML